MIPFPEEIARFLHANIESVEQLEILRVLASDREKDWKADELAPVVQAEPQTTARDLAALERRGLVTALDGPRLAYRYGPQGRDLEVHLSCLLKHYNERPVSMIRMIYAMANNTLRTFADAFRIRKDD